MNEMMEEEHVLMAQNTIIIPSESSSSDDSLETLSDDSYDSGGRQISAKLVTSSNKAYTFPAKHNYDNEETPLKNPCWTMDIKKRSFRNNQKGTFELWL